MLTPPESLPAWPYSGPHLDVSASELVPALRRDVVLLAATDDGSRRLLGRDVDGTADRGHLTTVGELRIGVLSPSSSTTAVSTPSGSAWVSVSVSVPTW